jgi:hypothetical protein
MEFENYVLMTHYGYLGVVPQPFTVDWELKPKVLAIVDESPPHAMDARM